MPNIYSVEEINCYRSLKMSFWLENKGLTRRTNGISPILYPGNLPYTEKKLQALSIKIRLEIRTLPSKRNHEFPPGLQHPVLYREKWDLLSGAALG